MRLANYNLPDQHAGPRSEEGVLGGPLVIETATSTMAEYPVILSTQFELPIGPVVSTLKAGFFTIPCNLLPLVEEKAAMDY